MLTFLLLRHRPGNSWKLWEARLWIGLDANSIPEDTNKDADLASFPYSNTNLGGADTHTFSVFLDSAAACASAAEYQVAVVTYSFVGDPCIPFNGTCSGT